MREPLPIIDWTLRAGVKYPTAELSYELLERKMIKLNQCYTYLFSNMYGGLGHCCSIGSNGIFCFDQSYIDEIEDGIRSFGKHFLIPSAAYELRLVLEDLQTFLEQEQYETEQEQYELDYE